MNSPPLDLATIDEIAKELQARFGYGAFVLTRDLEEGSHQQVIRWWGENYDRVIGMAETAKMYVLEHKVQVTEIDDGGV